MYSIFVVLCLVDTAFAGSVASGPCPHVEVVPNFNISKFFGKWHLAEYFYTTSGSLSKCEMSYWFTRKDGTIGIDFFGTYIASGLKTIGKSTIRVPDASVPAKLRMRDTSFLFGIFPVKGPYWILGTDYDSFSVGFSCEDSLFFHDKSVSIWTRERDPDPSVIAKAYEVIKDNKLDTSNPFKMDQTNC